ncbi:hypothetical protein SAMN04488104_104834, partial [Algoriphagus faecimaris]
MEQISKCRLTCHRNLNWDFYEQLKNLRLVNSLRLFFSIFLTINILSSLSAYSQEPIDFSTSTPGCPQNNALVALVEFLDPNGEDFETEYNIGDDVDGKIFATFGGSSGNFYSIYAQYEIWVDDILVETRVECVSPRMNVPLGVPQDIGDFTWEWGKKLEIKNVYFAWQTGNGFNRDCDPGNLQSQCSFTPEGFLVRTPLVVDFDFTTNCNDFTVDFEDLTTGGNAPDGNDSGDYVYSWTFENGTPSTSDVANPQNINFGSAGDYDVTLSVTSEGITKSETKTITLLPAISSNLIKTEDLNCATGTGGVLTLLQPTGGDGNYTIDWSTDVPGLELEDNILVQSNLPVGNYFVTVSDGRGCSNNYSGNISIQGQAPAPTVEDQTVCQTVGSLSYDVTASEGFELIYFATETSETPITPSAVDTNVPGIYSVWVSQSNEFGCESARVEVSITVVKQPAPPVLIVPEPDCDAETVTITFTEEEDVEYSLNSDFSSFIVDGSFTANVESSGTVYARTIGSICVSSSDYDVEPAPVTPDAPALTVPDPECDAETVTITFTP